MLPPDFIITPEILRLVADLDEFKGQWRIRRSLSPDKLAGLRRVATIESVGSSTRTEGSKLTDHQVGELLGRLHLTEFKSRDEEEVAGYAYVTDQVFDAFEQIPVTENMIGQLVKLTGGKPSTLKLRVKELVEMGYLVPKGQGRGAHYARGQDSR